MAVGKGVLSLGRTEPLASGRSLLLRVVTIRCHCHSPSSKPVVSTPDGASESPGSFIKFPHVGHPQRFCFSSSRTGAGGSPVTSSPATAESSLLAVTASLWEDRVSATTGAQPTVHTELGGDPDLLSPGFSLLEES